MAVVLITIAHPTDSSRNLEAEADTEATGAQLMDMLVEAGFVPNSEGYALRLNNNRDIDLGAKLAAAAVKDGDTINVVSKGAAAGGPPRITLSRPSGTTASSTPPPPPPVSTPSENPIGKAIEDLFTREGWNINKRDDLSYSFGFRGQNDRYSFYAMIGEKNNILCIYAVMPHEVPDDKLQVAAEFCHRANYGLIIGCFELDFRDGEVRYKVSMNFTGYDPDPDHVNGMIDYGLLMADRYAPGLAAIVTSNQSAEDAIKEIEG